MSNKPMKHYRAKGSEVPPGTPLCKAINPSLYANSKRPFTEDFELTDNIDEVTCSYCLRNLVPVTSEIPDIVIANPVLDNGLQMCIGKAKQLISLS